MSGDGTQSPEFVKVAGSASEGAYLTNVGVPPERIPSAKAFIEKFKSKYPGTDFQPYDHYTYEAAKIALFALENAGAGTEPGQTDGLKLMAFLRTLKYDGVLGETRFDEKGDTLNKAISVYLVKDGKFAAQN
jgi:branched-chain amino acid transport system substrate-binding protein